MSLQADNDLIDELGGTLAVATLCEVSEAAVSQWRRHGVPKQRRTQIVIGLTKRNLPIPAALAGDVTSSVAVLTEQLKELSKVATPTRRRTPARTEES
jgi:hypothetical protein